MTISELLNIFSGIFNLKGIKGEEKLTNEVVQELKALTLEGRLNCLWFHVPNEQVIKNKNDVVRVRKMKCLGLIPGAPDIVFLAANQNVCLELKTATGRQSESQALFQNWSEHAHVPYYICRSVQDVKSVLKKEKILNV